MRLHQNQSWKGSRVAVVGLARSGVAACLFLRKRGASVVGTDRRPAVELGAEVSELQRSSVSLSLGAYPDFTSFDAVILSPGVDPHQDMFADAVHKGVPLLPELELGANEAKGRIVCITGTKGKSTTTMSLHAMLREARRDSRAVGNIGDPITAHVDGSTEDTVFVAEASSFQLETTRDFHPNIAVFLNLFPDHLDRHPTFESYAAAKAKIFANQTALDTAVLNAEDGKVMELAKSIRATKVSFRPSTSPISEPMPESRDTVTYFKDGEAVCRNFATTALFKEEDVRLPGAAVRANLLAAATAAHQLGVPHQAIRAAVQRFVGVPHTFERLGEVAGIAFFNDSKATTLESVRAALDAFNTPVIAIMGGRLKAGSFSSLKDVVAKNVRVVYAIGESRHLIRESLSEVRPVHESDSLDAAVHSAFAEAKAGDTILLSPGCASFDMFKDYADRGDTFRRAFQELAMQGVG